mmetsp:Transcript_31885/g.74567  ORF Transcript_31885/g.74567 Transcript_31885/m.74567 type:complete len:208 (-) Transcript_31885:1600-2223(-)
MSLMPKPSFSLNAVISCQNSDKSKSLSSKFKPTSLDASATASASGKYPRLLKTSGISCLVIVELSPSWSVRRIASLMLRISACWTLRMHIMNSRWSSRPDLLTSTSSKTAKAFSSSKTYPSHTRAARSSLASISPEPSLSNLLKMSTKPSYSFLEKPWRPMRISTTFRNSSKLTEPCPSSSTSWATSINTCCIGSIPKLLKSSPNSL